MFVNKFLSKFANKKNARVSFFESNENIQKKGSGPYCASSDNKSSSVTLNKLAMKAQKLYCNYLNLNQGTAVVFFKDIHTIPKQSLKKQTIV